MEANRIFEILREHGGQIVASQEAYEAIWTELAEYLGYDKNRANTNSPLMFCGVPVYWSRYSFPELMDMYYEFRHIAGTGKARERVAQ
jgi:hypothetical protein